MSPAGKFLRRGPDRHFHWCPACDEAHPLPDGWTFNGDFERPTFTPSFKHSGMQRVIVDRKWTGEWVRDAAGNPAPRVCHYILMAGVLNFCADCSHAMAGKSAPLQPWPEGVADFK
jgi:hypothetical protein